MPGGDADSALRAFWSRQWENVKDVPSAMWFALSIGTLMLGGWSWQMEKLRSELLKQKVELEKKLAEQEVERVKILAQLDVERENILAQLDVEREERLAQIDVEWERNCGGKAGGDAVGGN